MSEQLRLLDEPPPKAERSSALRAFHTRAQPMPVDEALAGEKSARRQEDIILAFFRSHPGERFTPSQIWHLFTASTSWRGVPITSIRRALSNLSKGNLARDKGGPPPLEHHERDRRPGPLGKPESTWSLSSAATFQVTK